MFLKHKTLPLITAAAGCGLLLATVGCGQRDTIARYTVPKPELVDPTLASRAVGPATSKTEQQTLGLIVPLGETSWFFKLTGEKEAVEPHYEAFVQFVSSIKFSSGLMPTWTLPDGWQQLPGSQFRFATIRMPQSSDSAKPLEITVSSAGGEVLANVNRWRGQLNLKPINTDELTASSKTLDVDGHQATLVSLVGTGSGGMGGAPFAPFAGGAALPPDHPPISKQPTTTSDKPKSN
jgi:hypothetical protein